MLSGRYEIDYDDIWRQYLIIDNNVSSKYSNAVATCDSATDAEFICECLNLTQYERPVPKT